jgi:hypothetical protein
MGRGGRISRDDRQCAVPVKDVVLLAVSIYLLKQDGLFACAASKIDSPANERGRKQWRPGETALPG